MYTGGVIPRPGGGGGASVSYHVYRGYDTPGFIYMYTGGVIPRPGGGGGASVSYHVYSGFNTEGTILLASFPTIVRIAIGLPPSFITILDNYM